MPLSSCRLANNNSSCRLPTRTVTKLYIIILIYKPKTFCTGVDKNSALNGYFCCKLAALNNTPTMLASSSCTRHDGTRWESRESRVAITRKFFSSFFSKEQYYFVLRVAVFVYFICVSIVCV